MPGSTTPDSIPDPVLVAAYRNGDERAAAELVRRHEERFASRAQEHLGLTTDQTAKLRSTSQQFGVSRGELRSRGRRLREALAVQLQPGVAADQDSVAKLTDALIELRIKEVHGRRGEMGGRHWGKKEKGWPGERQRSRERQPPVQESSGRI